MEPRFARLSEEQRRDAVALLADLLLEAARKRASASGGALDGVNGGASGGVDEFPDRRRKAPRLRVMRPIGDVDIRGAIRVGSSSAPEARPVRVSAERVFELARHLTERDREIAAVLFEQQVLTTDQLT